MDMDISQACIDLIKQFEGLAYVSPKDGLVYPYKDPIGLPTIGFGSRIALDGSQVTMNTPPMTVAQAEDLLHSVLQQFIDAVNNLVRVEVTQNQFDALVDFCYNAGAANLQSSTLLQMVNAGNMAGASQQFIRWNKARDRKTGQLVVLPGLTRRRQAETNLFNTPDEE
jgi:lysozyme